MPTKKRTAKKTTRKKRSNTARKSDKRSGFFSGFVFKTCILLLLIVIGLVAVYALGSVETRSRFHDQAITLLNPLRTANWMPSPIAAVMDSLHDQIPSSEGFIVDGGELGRDASPFIAGIPLCKIPIKALHNSSYINLFDNSRRQTVCVAYRLDSAVSRNDTEGAEQFILDPRVPDLTLHETNENGWRPQALAPTEALTEAFGSKGKRESMLASNCVPLSDNFHDGVWAPLVRKVTTHYVKRFDEIWIYSGPIYKSSKPKVSGELPTPDALYLIVFDLTELGGLRALSFIVPTNADKDVPLSDHLSSIEMIQNATRLQFLPDIGYDAKDALTKWQSPRLW
ncbi:MAG: DNA/RNA non-specific endonuclease [Opitutaceae bacterium]